MAKISSDTADHTVETVTAIGKATVLNVAIVAGFARLGKGTQEVYVDGAEYKEGFAYGVVNSFIDGLIGGHDALNYSITKTEYDKELKLLTSG